MGADDAIVGDGVRSRCEVAMKNEVLCKLVAHNICCLIMSQLELGIEVEFWGVQTEQRADATAEAVAAPVTVQAVDAEPSVPIQTCGVVYISF